MKYDLNDGKCKSIIQYVIGGSDLERVDVINDLGVLIDNRMTFVDHIESIVSKSARMLVFCPARFEVCIVRERIQHNFIRFALWDLGWTTQSQ
jgi:hypothetical protein